MMQQKDNVIWHKFNAISRYFLAYGFSGIMPFYIVNEYPKSGGSWLSQMLAACLDVPYPRNRLPMLRPCILHEHFIWPGILQNVVVVWRDGRDLLISQYYHSLVRNDRGNRILVERVTADLQLRNVHDIQNNLPFFMEYVFKQKKNPKFSWKDFVLRWQNQKHTVHVRYEDLRVDCAQQLQRLVRALSGNELSDEQAKAISEKFSFEKQSGRKPGQENIRSFMRKGIVGDWKNHFSAESKQIFDYYAGDCLISLGYEPDNSWVDHGDVIRFDLSG